MSNANKSDYKEKAINLAFKFTFFLYLAFNIVAVIIYLYDGTLGGDLEGLNYQAKTYNILFFGIVSTALLIISFVCIRFMRLKNSISLSRLVPTSYFYFFVLCFSFLVVFAVFYGGEGTIHRDKTTHRWAELFFAFFNPYIFLSIFVLISFSEENKNNFKKSVFLLVLFIYIFLILNSGFISFFILIMPILIYPLVVFFKGNVIWVWSVMFFSMIFFPVIRFFKWILIIGFDKFSFSYVSIESYLNLAKSTIERFSYVANAIFVSEVPDKSSFLSFEYFPGFQGYINNFVLKIFGGNADFITLHLYERMRGISGNSNSTFPMISYFSLEPFYGFLVMFYSLAIIVCLLFFLRVFLPSQARLNGATSFILFFFVNTYVLNGWYWEASGFIQASLILISLLLVDDCFFRVNVRRNSEC